MLNLLAARVGVANGFSPRLVVVEFSTMGANDITQQILHIGALLDVLYKYRSRLAYPTDSPHALPR